MCYEQVLLKLETNLNTSLHPSILIAIQDAKISLGARSEAILSMSTHDSEKVVRKLIDRQAASPRNAKWSRELAVLQLWVAKAEAEFVEPAIDKGIQNYLKLASGSPVGSDSWFEARIRLANCYQLLGKQEHATQALALTVAMVVETPQKWKVRLKLR